MDSWEDDNDVFGTGTIWTTPKKYLRKAILVELASEIGDINTNVSSFKANLAKIGVFDDKPDLPQKENRKISMGLRAGVEVTKTSASADKEVDLEVELEADKESLGQDDSSEEGLET